MRGRYLLGAAVGLTAAATYAGVSVYGAYRVTTRARKRPAIAPEAIAPAGEVVRFAGRDGTILAGWWFPTAGTERALILGVLWRALPLAQRGRGG